MPGEYITAIVQRELACLGQCSKFPDPQGFYQCPGQYEPKVETKKTTLQNFLKVVKYLIPKDITQQRAVLWHTDLHLDNIFVKPQDPSEITAIIDWQAVHIAPLFMQARRPAFLDLDDAILQDSGLDDVDLPEYYENLSKADQEKVRRARGAKLLWKLHEAELACQCQVVNEGIECGESLPGRLVAYAGNVFSDGEPLVDDLLIQMQHEWISFVDDIKKESCHLHFTESDIVNHKEQFALWANSIRLKKEFLSRFGQSHFWDGRVAHDEYKAGKAKMKTLQDEFVAQHSSNELEQEQWVKAWPFTD